MFESAGYQTGLWTDYSRPTGLQQIITLPTREGNYFLSFLTLLVTMAGTSAWGIMAFWIHSHIARSRKDTDIYDLQQQVSLRNAKSPVGTLLEATKLHRAWRKKNSPSLIPRTATVVIPALILYALITVSSIFASRVATTKDTGVTALLKSRGCGIVNLPNGLDPEQTSASHDKLINDTLMANQYANNFYSNKSASFARSPYVKPTFKYTRDTRVKCPFSNQTACFPGTSAFELVSEKLDSSDMLGINAPTQDRVTVQVKDTCQLVYELPYLNQTDSFIWYNFGILESGALGSEGSTFTMPKSRLNDKIGYQIVSTDGSWQPRADIWVAGKSLQEDYDMGMAIFTANAVRYDGPVKDPFFRTGDTVNSQGRYEPYWWATMMVCYDQYRWCNPANDRCIPWSNYHNFTSSYRNDGMLGMNDVQEITVARLSLQMQQLSILNPVTALGSAALRASNKVMFNQESSVLPDNQWQIEVEGWFQTKLSILQANVAAFVVRPDKTSNLPFISAYNQTQLKDMGANDVQLKAVQSQCDSQLVITNGEVQNFSLAGVLIIVIISCLLALINFFIKEMMDLLGSFFPGNRATHARQGDDKFHLLRMALASNGYPSTGKWELGSSKVPVTDTREQVVHLERESDLTFYPSKVQLLNNEQKWVA